MTINDILELFCDYGCQKIKVYDCAKEDDVYEGYPDSDFEYGDYEICSIDSVENNTITFNIDTSEGE